jgi:hypothetical protein
LVDISIGFNIPIESIDFFIVLVKGSSAARQSVLNILSRHSIKLLLYLFTECKIM